MCDAEPLRAIRDTLATAAQAEQVRAEPSAVGTWLVSEPIRARVQTGADDQMCVGRKTACYASDSFTFATKLYCGIAVRSRVPKPKKMNR